MACKGTTDAAALAPASGKGKVSKNIFIAFSWGIEAAFKGFPRSCLCI